MREFAGHGARPSATNLGKAQRDGEARSPQRRESQGFLPTEIDLAGLPICFHALERQESKKTGSPSSAMPIRVDMDSPSWHPNSWW
jgi:hypothetical protein